MANPNVINMRGTAAARPAAGLDGRYYWAYDTKSESRDNGSTWETVTPAAGAIGSILAIDGGGDLAYTPTFTQGPTFPGSPADGDQHLRTDLGNGWVWDNSLSVWLGPERDLTFTPSSLLPISTVAQLAFSGLATGAQVLITGFQVMINVEITNDVSNYWGILLEGPFFSGAFTASTATLGPDAPTEVPTDFSTPELSDPGPNFFILTSSQVGSPGNITKLWVSILVRDALT